MKRTWSHNIHYHFEPFTHHTSPPINLGETSKYMCVGVLQGNMSCNFWLSKNVNLNFMANEGTLQNIPICVWCDLLMQLDKVVPKTYGVYWVVFNRKLSISYTCRWYWYILRATYTNFDVTSTNMGIHIGYNSTMFTLFI